MRLSTLEMPILAALMAVSAGLFGWRMRRIADVIGRTRRDPDFRLRPVAWRVKRFAWEVLLQAKVIRERPLAGAAHAVVFWGFCAFALFTAHHLLSGFGLPLFDEAAPFGRAYRRVVAAFAAAVAVAIAGLFVRRFVVRPLWLGKLSAESGVIAGLIFILMATYLVGMPEVGLDGAVARVNWWLHTAALVVFLPLVPRTKHLHLLLSPVTVFFERRGFSHIPPLAGDEDFGLESGKDVTRVDALQAYTCVECGRCTEHCPAYNTGKVLNPKEIVLGLRRYLDAEGPESDRPLLGAHISQEAAFQCTTCGACEYQCPVGIQHLPVIVGLRRGAVNTGKWEDDHGTRLFLAMERNGNSLGFAAGERQKFIEANGLPYWDGSQEYCLWLGCMGSYDPQGREVVLALARVLGYLGIGFGVPRRERCTGDPARRLGNDLLFEQMAEANIAELEAAGVRKMVAICPHCVRTIGTDWGEFGARFEIEHHSELLARHASRLPARRGERVVFHDPCYLGRYRGVYDEPRRVIGRSATVEDPRRARRRSFCCGAGGGQMFLGEEKGRRVNVERATELAATGAPVVGTACPFCQTMFRDAFGTLPEAPKLLDIAQIAAASLDRVAQP